MLSLLEIAESLGQYYLAAAGGLQLIEPQIGVCSLFIQYQLREGMS